MSAFRLSSSTRLKLFAAASAACIGAGLAGVAHATPYASNVTISGTTVNFILNENADWLTYSINGGPELPLATGKGAKTFSLAAPGDSFAISTAKTDTVGYKIPTGGTIAAVPLGLSQATAAGGTRQLSDDTSPLTHFNSPRGVGVSTDPNASNFGTAYISNSAAGSTAAAPIR